MQNELVAQALGLGDDHDQPTRTRLAVLYLRVSTSRQAHKNGETEGYSIPAQRAACTRKVDELGGIVAEEFVDAGASARSADRDGLQDMLKYIAENRVDYVVVHKLDRLARDRADDVQILLAIKNAGAVLISVSENIDDTPAGKLQHAVMAGLAEYYSSNLSAEAKKGIAQKAKNGGTHGVAPIGYLNTLERREGREVKGIILDPDRTEHIAWAFRTYAEGNVSISTLRDLLEERGLRSRRTIKYLGTPLSNAQVHRMLSNPYYIGKIQHLGVIYDGAHEHLIDDDTWYQVQRVLSGRRMAGDRSWRHDHPLKGTLTCNRCGGRIGFGYSKGRGGVYAYFFCLGRHTGRTNCDLPYLPVDEVERAVLQEWDTRVRLEPEQIALTREAATTALDMQRGEDQQLLGTQEKRLRELEVRKQRLIDALLDGVIPASDVKPRQAAIGAEIEDAKRLIRVSTRGVEVVKQRIETLLQLLERAGDLYRTASDDARRLLNQAVFTTIRIDSTDDGETLAPIIEAEAELAAPVAAILEFAQEAERVVNSPHVARRGATAPILAQQPLRQRYSKTPGQPALAGGSNLTYLAVPVGFEPDISEPGDHASAI